MVADVPMFSAEISNIFGDKSWFLLYNISGKKLHLRQRKEPDRLLGSAKSQELGCHKVHKSKKKNVFIWKVQDH